MLFILFATAFGQVCQTSDFNGVYAKGDSIVVCLFFQATSLYRQVYQLKVDQYTALLVSGAYTKLQGTSSTISANCGNTAPQYSPKYTQSSGAFPIQSLVIQMAQGYVIDVFWDNVCFDGGTCQENTYTTTQGSVSENNDLVTSCNGGACDPKVYISFLGTDSNGQYFQSSGNQSVNKAFECRSSGFTRQHRYSQILRIHLIMQLNSIPIILCQQSDYLYEQQISAGHQKTHKH